MGLFDKIKKFISGGGDTLEEEFETIVTQTYEEYAKTHDYWWNVEVNTTKIWSENVKEWPDKKKVNFILWLIPVIHQYVGKPSWSAEDRNMRIYGVRLSYVRLLFRSKLILEDVDAAKIGDAFVQNSSAASSIMYSGIMQWPVNHFINQLSSQKKSQPISFELATMLQALKKKILDVQGVYEEKERLKLIDKIDGLLFLNGADNGSIKSAKFLGNDELALFANPMIEAMPEAEKLQWYVLLPKAQKVSGSKPSGKYLDETKAIIKEMGVEKFKKTLHEWMQFLVDLKEKEQTHFHDYGNGAGREYNSIDYLTSVNQEAMKGLVWICSHFHDNTTIQTIAALAERTYRKIPGKGPAAASLGNACLYTLYKSKGLDGIGQLSRLKLRIKQASTQAAIDKYLQAAAEEQGVTVSEIEDMAVDDCGLENGSRSWMMDDYKAELIITGIGKTETKWYKPDGALQKSVPAVVKEKHAAKLKKIKDSAKQVEQSLVAQRDRIDRMFRDDRKISKENFEQYYLNHGLVSYIARRIIWNFHLADKTISAIYLNNYWVNQQNEIVEIENAATIALWHPVQATVEEIKTWREFLIFHQLQQPLKQAFREVYLLTEAEFNTRSYSNRMAAHLLRQHQFNSLAKTRGWRYSLMGAFDNGINNDKATLTLTEHNLRAEYWITEVNADGAMNDTGIWDYVSTDQVRFVNTTTDATVDLVAIAPLIFSEVLRDVDLFVGVASVGNDPAWQDGGGLPAYRDYWTSYSFGELGEVAKNRKEILSGLVPRLKIKNVATIKDRFLVVTGKLRTYKIHLGSTNILMEPNDQYLCIVADRSQKNHTENLFLPFEGDNGLSIILSKAFLLAEDDKITDTTITSQINRK